MIIRLLFPLLAAPLLFSGCTSREAIRQELDPLAERIGAMEKRIGELGAKVGTAAGEAASGAGKKISGAAGAVGEKAAAAAGGIAGPGKEAEASANAPLNALEEAAKRLEKAADDLKSCCAACRK